MLFFYENCYPSFRQIICEGISDCDLLSRKAPLFSEERISDAGRMYTGGASIPPEAATFLSRTE
ncbi:MAG: hypothetical protein M1304_02395 [Candidatus Thermoplasmatota archaeon]|jgi:hypothetical protein|nr:hypothetical protein [Candidatus Thermoplasmatota archaeon]